MKSCIRRSSNHGRKIKQPPNPLPKGRACTRCREHRIRCDGALNGCTSCKRAARHVIGGEVPDSAQMCIYVPRKSGPTRRRKAKPAVRSSSPSATSTTSTSADETSAPSSSNCSDRSNSVDYTTTLDPTFNIDFGAMAFSPSGSQARAPNTASTSHLNLTGIPLYLLTPGSQLRRQMEQVLGIDSATAKVLAPSTSSAKIGPVSPLTDFKAMIDFNNSLLDSITDPQLADTSRSHPPLFIDSYASLCSSPSPMSTPDLPSYFHPDAPQLEYERRTNNSGAIRSSFASVPSISKLSLSSTSTSTSASSFGSANSSPYPTFSLSDVELASTTWSSKLQSTFPSIMIPTVRLVGATSTSTTNQGCIAPVPSWQTLTLALGSSLLTPSGGNWSSLKTPTADRTPGPGFTWGFGLADFSDVEGWLDRAMRA